MPLELLLSLGVLSLYLGFCGAFGCLLRLPRMGSYSGRVHVGVAAALLLAPATAFVLAQPDVPLPMRLLTFVLGAGVAAAAYLRPAWTPVRLWQRPFARAYFAGAMGITALWELATALTQTSPAASILAAAAGLAGAASLAARQERR
jgi:hypothetical protein